MKIERPHRTKRTHIQSLSAPPDAVFPLLCPVREADWIPDWDPRLVLSKSGLVEEDCIFITPPDPARSTPPADAIWIVSHHDPEAHRLTMYKVTPGVTVARLDISLAPRGDGGTAATISYEHTALGPRGDEFLRGFTAEAYREFMEAWETMLDHYLTTGERLE